MCCSIKIIDENDEPVVWADTVGNLIELHMKVIKDENYCVIRYESCLCSVDIEKTAKENGYFASMTNDRMDWIFKRMD